MGVVTSYAYAVNVFELLLLVMFTYLFVIHLEDDFEGCTSFLSIRIWGTLSLLTGYAVCLSSFACAFLKHIMECKQTGDRYPEVSGHSMDLMYGTTGDGLRGSMKRIPRAVHVLAILHILALLIFVAWSVIGIVVIAEDHTCLDKELYQVMAVWLTLSFLSLCMSCCCCFCTYNALFAELIGSLSKQNNLTEYVQSFHQL